MKSVHWTLKLWPLILCSRQTLFCSAIIAIYSYLAISNVPPVLAINATSKKSPSDLAVHSRTMPEIGQTAPNLDDDDEYFEDDDELSETERLKKNGTAKGMYIGADCEFTCNPRLRHVFCDPSSNTCGCEKNYPVIIGLTKGCAKPKKLGDQCFWHETCTYNDPNSLCVQVSHNALCQCADGFHSVSYQKPTKRVFCTEDMAAITSDLPTLLGVITGIVVLAGLICMVLHLFSKTKYPRHRNFADANLPPPILYSSDTGIPLTIQSARPSSRSSIRSSGSIGSFTNRRSSSAPQAGSKGVLVSTSRTGSRRPSLASVHSTSSSVKSYSMMRFEKELEQKQLRQEMKVRLAQLQRQNNLIHNRPQITIVDAMHMAGPSRSSAATPSPMTPNSTDELLPIVDENQEFTSLFTSRPCVSFSGAGSSTEGLL
ncbi:uncharacterized protein LOC129804009 isoform X2 [Phlebotomus papatasi]|uniref:uncharacterized protein LOC129804009 isoform X2 n=1 Tax=Phlebotomus papatasi TaxID=29031 RepID=UPI0024840451|nr:uncharacterized protein LOC129804009 isoform X2 [Phlebotomus papatasi]